MKKVTHSFVGTAKDLREMTREALGYNLVICPHCMERGADVDMIKTDNDVTPYLCHDCGEKYCHFCNEREIEFEISDLCWECDRHIMDLEETAKPPIN